MPICAYEETLTCPYDATHQILPARMQFHLVRCRRQHTEADFAICPFNSIHHVPRMELRYHVAECPDRVSVEQELYSFPTETAVVDLPKPNTSNTYGMNGEDWEAEATVGYSYDPLANCRDRIVLMQPRGLSKAGRKKFREDERKRLENLKNPDRQQESRAAVASVRLENQVVEKLRRPANLLRSIQLTPRPLSPYSEEIYRRENDGLPEGWHDNLADNSGSSSFARSQLASCVSHLPGQSSSSMHSALSAMASSDGVSLQSSAASSVPTSRVGVGRGRGRVTQPEPEQQKRPGGQFVLQKRPKSPMMVPLVPILKSSQPIRRPEQDFSFDSEAPTPAFVRNDIGPERRSEFDFSFNSGVNSPAMDRRLDLDFSFNSEAPTPVMGAHLPIVQSAFARPSDLDQSFFSDASTPPPSPIPRRRDEQQEPEFGPKQLKSIQRPRPLRRQIELAAMRSPSPAPSVYEAAYQAACNAIQTQESQSPTPLRRPLEPMGRSPSPAVAQLAQAASNLSLMGAGRGMGPLWFQKQKEKLAQERMASGNGNS